MLTIEELDLVAQVALTYPPGYGESFVSCDRITNIDTAVHFSAADVHRFG